MADLAEGLARSATLLSAGLLIGICCALVWSVLAGRLSASRRVEMAALLA